MNEIKSTEEANLMVSIRDTAIQLLRSHNNTPNKVHREALEKVAIEISVIAYSDQPTKLAVALETGMGKTTTIIASIIAMQATNLSALICVDTVEQMNELYTDCINKGVNPNLIGAFHKVKNHQSGLQSIAKENADKYQFLIVSHNKMYFDSKRYDEISGDSLTYWMNRFGGKERSIVFWDERLEPKSCFSLLKSTIRSAIGAWIPIYEEKLNSHKFLNMREDLKNTVIQVGTWIQEASVLLSTAINDEVILFPELDISIQDAKNSLAFINSERKGYIEENECILELIKFSQRGTVRTIKAHNKFNLIQFEDQFHQSFRKLVIFDATLPIRELNKIDKSIRVLELEIRKSYKDVTINWTKISSSKDFLTSHKHKARNLTVYYQEINSIINQEIPATEEVLIFTFKAIREEVNNYFKNKYDGRIHVSHWGAHKASNRLSHVKYIITLGIIRRSHQDLIANILGAKNNIESPVTIDEIKAVEHTEMADTLIQAFGRAHNRVIKHGCIAGETTIWLYLPNKDSPVIDAIKSGMSDVIVRDRNQSKHFLSAKNKMTKTQIISDEIDEVISTLKKDKFSLKELRNSFNPKIESTDKGWKRGLDRFLEINSDLWAQRGKLIESKLLEIDQI